MVNRKIAKKGATKARAKSISSSITAENLFQHLKLLHVRLINVEARVSIKGGKTPDKAQIVSGANIGIGSENKNLHINAVIDVLGRPDLESTDGSELHIHLEYQAVFQILDTKPEELLKFPNELISAGMLIIWPNFREAIISLTSKMSIPPLILPMFVAGTSGVKIGASEIKYIPSDRPPDVNMIRNAANKNPKRIQGYH